MKQAYKQPEIEVRIFTECLLTQSNEIFEDSFDNVQDDNWG